MCRTPAGHADPATTRAYDAARGLLDRHPAYPVGAHLAAAPRVSAGPQEADGGSITSTGVPD